MTDRTNAAVGPGAGTGGGGSFPPLDPDDGLPLSPTDIAQFIRLEQCRRYLRLRLHERAVDRGFLRAYGVTPQVIPPLLTRSGAACEAWVEAAVIVARSAW